jgi:predicted AAA+ superfamily ATPase
MIKRIIEDKIEDYLAGEAQKILFIWGPRRSGKTTLVQKVGRRHGARVFNFDLLSDREKFKADKTRLEKLAREEKIILIDEVQNGPEATVGLKILHDLYNVKIITTGSSELRQKGSGEFDSLAGRFMERYCLPLSAAEMTQAAKPKAYEEGEFYRRLAEQVQVFGAYPEVYDGDWDEKEKIELLKNLVETYVLKDVVSIYELKNLKLARDILVKIGLQLGSEVSVREIAGSVQASVPTVASYIEIYIKNYVLIPLPSFKTNLRRAVSENRKLYFYDLGIRNALVEDFRELRLRPDRGGLWENYVVAEMEKRRRNENMLMNMYFYREYGGKEVDLVLADYHKRYTCVEMKLAKAKAKSVFPLPHRLKVVNPENYQEMVSAKEADLFGATISEKFATGGMG